MRLKKFTPGVIALAILIIIVAVVLWLLIPLHPSARKNNLHGQAYMAGMIRMNVLWDRPFSSIIAALPGNTVAVGNIPFFLRPLVPPTVEFYLQDSKSGGGWAIAADLGWRSKIFRMLHNVIIGQMQYRGVGAIEDDYNLRTPAGTRLLFYQDGGTLFVAEGENIIERILVPDSITGHNVDRADLQNSILETQDKRVMTNISFSNIDGDVTKGIEMMEGKAGFMLFPSAGSLIKGSMNIRQTGRDTIAGAITLVVREDGDIEGVEGDAAYLTDLIDRFLSAQDMKSDRTINREDSKITIQIMIHPDGGE